jgi:hypothetical protein
MSTGAMIAVGAALPFLGLVIAFLAIRRLAARPVKTAAPLARCSRCDREVPASELRPWSELRMRCCPDCDSELTGLIFPDPSSPGYDPDTHHGYLAAYREAREA